MTPHAKQFLSKLWALKKKLRLTDHALSIVLGKHRETLERWKSGKSSPTVDDIADACCKLSKELTRRDKQNERDAAEADAIETFLVTFLNETGFKSRTL